MAVIPVTFAQVNYKFVGAGVPLGAQVTLGVSLDGIEDTPVAVATAAAAAWSTGIRNQVSNEVTLASVLAKMGPNDVGPSAEIAVNQAGANAVASCAPNTAVLIRKITAMGGHAARGRMYWPGIDETKVGSNGDITPSALAAWQSDVNDTFDFLLGAELTPVVLHGESSPLTLPTVITSFVVDPKVATQRRRLRH